MSPRVLLVGSLGFTLLFNVAWAWGTGALSVVAAAVCTLIVPAGLHLWPQVPAVTWPRRVLRAFVMSGICVAATVTSFSHSVTVLIAAGWTPPTAWSVTGGAELLVALSTMAVIRPVQRAVQVGVPVDVQPSTALDGGPVQAADTLAEDDAEMPVQAGTPRHRKLSAVNPDRSADFRQWVSELDARPTEYAVRQRYGCRQSVAQRLLAELDEESDDRAAV